MDWMLLRHESAVKTAVSQIYNSFIYMGYHTLAEKGDIFVNNLAIRVRKFDMIVLTLYKVVNSIITIGLGWGIWFIRLEIYSTWYNNPKVN